jgi:competence protein ComEA
MPLSLRAGWNLGLAAAAVVAVLVLGLRSEDTGIEIEPRDPAAGIDELRVDVAGAVPYPGVVTVTPGERVTDALARAGGPTPDAETATLNLSRRLVDEDHIAVPRRGERAALLDLNRATATQLEALPGIGAVAAAAIVSARQRDGPFQSTDDLVDRRVLTPRTYAQVRDLLAVH